MSGEDDGSDWSELYGFPLWAVAIVAVAVLVMTALIGGTVLLVAIGMTVDDGSGSGTGAGSSSGAGGAATPGTPGAAATVVAEGSTPAPESGTPTPVPGTPTADASTPVPERESSYSIRIDYRGAWQGAVSLTGGGSSTTESISGSGPTTIEITGEPDIVSANAQKQDSGGGTLTIEIRHDGEVVARATTSAQYGVAQVSESFY
jgi:hypothetical protein